MPLSYHGVLERLLAGLLRVASPAVWSWVRETRNIVVDYPDPWELLVVGAPKPDTVDGDGLRPMIRRPTARVGECSG